jgi:hypothetical protein
MECPELRDQFTAYLVDRAIAGGHPSPTMLDRAERAIRDPETACAYIEALLQVVEQERYPSPVMLDRISRLLDAVQGSPSYPMPDGSPA